MIPLKNGSFEENEQEHTAVAPERTKENEKQSFASGILLYLHDLVFLVAAVFLVFSLLFRFVVVSGPSMYDTLVDGDFLFLISNTFYRKPEQGDIVVISKHSFDDGAPIVKRIIATEGQTVDIDFDAGIVYVDGTALDEEYTQTPTNQYEGVRFPLTVEPGCVFVLGDNRNISKDSRHPDIGLIDKREIIGKAVFLVFPGNNQGAEERQLNRIGVIA